MRPLTKPSDTKFAVMPATSPQTRDVALAVDGKTIMHLAQWTVKTVGSDMNGWNTEELHEAASLAFADEEFEDVVFVRPLADRKDQFHVFTRRRTAVHMMKEAIDGE